MLTTKACDTQSANQESVFRSSRLCDFENISFNRVDYIMVGRTDMPWFNTTHATDNNRQLYKCTFGIEGKQDN